MDAIAYAYIGGVAASVGVDRVTNTLVGIFDIMSMTDGMNLLQVDISLAYYQ